MKRLWVRCPTPNERQTCWALEKPGDEWVELSRPVLPEEQVRIIDGKAEIVAVPAEPEPDPRRAVLFAALPDILLAVAEGADLREELRKVLEVERE